MTESKTKEIKAVDKKNLEKITRAAMRNDNVAYFLLDTIAQFIKGSPDASYASSREFFETPDAFLVAARKVDALALDKYHIENIMKRITGESSQGNGDIYAAITNSDKVNEYIDFFPYFRALSKMCHLSITMKKQVNLKKKVQQNLEKAEKLEAEL